MRKNILAGRTGPDVFPAAAELSFLPCRDERQALVLPGRGGVRLDLPLPRTARREPAGSSRPAPSHGRRPLQPRHHARARLGRRDRDGDARRDVRAPVGRARGGVRQEPAPLGRARPDQLRADRRAPGGRAPGPLSPARHRRGAGGGDRAPSTEDAGGARHHRAADQGRRHGAAANRRRPQAAGRQRGCRPPSTCTPSRRPRRW